LILIDASVLIEYLRHRNAAIGVALGELDLGIGGVTRAEVLHGARNASDWDKLIILLDQFQPVEMLERSWEATGRLLYQLRVKGLIVPFQGRSAGDNCYRAQLSVVGMWGHDRHFQLISQVAPLRLFEGPPLIPIED
jgi:predicted nucleic acid-binding protein